MNDPLSDRSHSYIPPAKAALLRRQIANKESDEYQRITWDALKKSIHGLVNKVNTSNVRNIVVELFRENLVRGRGHFCKTMMRSQFASPAFTPIYACLVAIVNTKLPQIGELLLERLILSFRKAYRRNDKELCHASATFIAHLVNFRMVHELLAFQLLTLLLERPTDDSVELAAGFIRECGAYLAAVAANPTGCIFERLRTILYEGEIDKRIQYMIEDLFQLRKEHFKGHPPIAPELDLIDDEDQITHSVSLDDEIDPQEELNIYQFSECYLDSEKKYEAIKAEILGDSSDDDDVQKQLPDEANEEEPQQDGEITDKTGADVANLRKTIYLIVMSSIEFQETVHKLLKLKVPPGLECEICSMIVDCCGQEKTYLKHYGLIGERLCKLAPQWAVYFERSFFEQYEAIHRLETNQIRNIARFFAHLMESDSVVWSIFDAVKITEEDTDAAGRIFLKILFQDLEEHYGKKKLREKLFNPLLSEFMHGVFPASESPPQDIRFAVNFFTVIGMGYLTDEMRAALQATGNEAEGEP